MTNNNDFYYGLLQYSSINIGDEIQSIAASRFLPQIDKLVHRERINLYKSDKKTKLICNAWWMWRPENFPPSSDIEPLLISMYINKDIRNKFLTDETKKYLIEHGPVGCRDKSTAKYLQDNGVPSYFSGCCTLTLQRNPEFKRKNFILAVDLDKNIVDEIRKRTNRPVYDLTVLLLPNLHKKRFDMAKTMLYLYQSAHCVVSSRLHVCMPCLAMETPVLMMDASNNVLSNDGRYEGLKDLCNLVKETEFVSNKDIYDFENPPKNPDKYLELRNNIIKTCSEFTGYNCQESPLAGLNEDEMLLNLIHALEYNYSTFVKYFQWFIKPYDLVKTFFRGTLLKQTRHDILETSRTLTEHQMK